MSVLARQRAFPAEVSRINPTRPMSRQAVVFALDLLGLPSDEGAQQPVVVITRKVELHLFQHLVGAFQQRGDIAGIGPVSPHTSPYILDRQQRLDAQCIEPASAMVGGCFPAS